MFFITGIFTIFGFAMLSVKLIDPSSEPDFSHKFSDSNIISISVNDPEDMSTPSMNSSPSFSEKINVYKKTTSCATVEEMGEVFKPAFAAWKESLRVRRLIHHHFLINGKYFQLLFFFLCFFNLIIITTWEILARNCY